MNPFSRFPHDKIEIIAPGGEVRANAEGIFTPEEIIVFDDSITALVGDEVRRRLPNGQDETFTIIDSIFQGGLARIPSHYRLVIRRKGMFPHGEGGNFTINVSGPNSRVNVGSTDNSQNVVGNDTVFGDLLRAVDENVHGADRDAIFAAIQSMQDNRDSDGFKRSYQDFITSAAAHMGIIAPFLPAISQML